MMINNSNFKKELPCKVTETEILAYGKELARLQGHMEELAGRKKRVMSDLGAEEKRLDAEMSKVSRIISTGEEFRDIDVKWHYDWENNAKHLLRQDTYETVKTEGITDTEKQEKLDLEQDEAMEQAEKNATEEGPVDVEFEEEHS